MRAEVGIEIAAWVEEARVRFLLNAPLCRSGRRHAPELSRRMHRPYHGEVGHEIASCV